MRRVRGLTSQKSGTSSGDLEPAESARDERAVPTCVELFRFVDCVQICGINRGHSAGHLSLQGDEGIVTSIFLAVANSVNDESMSLRESFKSRTSRDTSCEIDETQENLLCGLSLVASCQLRPLTSHSKRPRRTSLSPGRQESKTFQSTPLNAWSGRNKGRHRRSQIAGLRAKPSASLIHRQLERRIGTICEWPVGSGIVYCEFRSFHVESVVCQTVHDVVEDSGCQ